MTGMNGFERQLRTWRSALDAGAERVGWKTALGLVDDQEEPQLGHRTSATRIEEGGTYHRGGDRELRAEAELAVVVDAGYAAGIELVDVGRPPRSREHRRRQRLPPAAAGERLEPGDVLLTGSRIHVPVAPGELVELDMGSLGRLGVRIAA
jgi:2-keto-4-pentenoate hydratase